MKKRSSNTFQEEFQQLLEIPGALWGTDHEYFDIVGIPYPERLRQSEAALSDFPRPLEGPPRERVDIPREPEWRASIDLPAIISILNDQELSQEEFFNRMSEILQLDLQRAYEDMEAGGFTGGNMQTNLNQDAFGCYLPMHAFYKSPKNPWGIYMYLLYILKESIRLKKVFPKLKGWQMLRMFWLCVYRHELFHFHTEHYATTYEIALQKAFYRPYAEDVKSKVAGTEDWLEEALAENSVLQSRLVKGRGKFTKATLQKIYKYHLQTAPPGYRDYHCEKFGGPQVAMQILSGQIIQQRLKPSPLPAPISSISNHFGIHDKKVPGYIVVDPALDVYRFQ